MDARGEVAVVTEDVQVAAKPRRRTYTAEDKHALTAPERAAVLTLLHEQRFVDLPPAQVWAQVLDAGQVPPCSIRTMYRVLAANAEVRERHNQLRHLGSRGSS